MERLDADLYNCGSRRRRTVLDARRYENSVRFDSGKRQAEIERVGNSVMWKSNDGSGTSEADSARRQIMTTERGTLQRQRPSDITVNHLHAGTGNAIAVKGSGGGRLLAVNMLQNVEVVDVDGTHATDVVTDSRTIDQHVYNRRHVTRHVKQVLDDVKLTRAGL